MNGGKHLARERAGDFVAGHWTRVAGRQGVWTALSGTCDAGGDVPTALAGWFSGDLSGW
ncbi:MAG: hypothetical protein H6736_12770 [Alphaproteobacteria bacterium]|nr:hypothetical protein [Alphaproteobacteria bacterium]